jgi:chromosome segregation ATPase
MTADQRLDQLEPLLSEAMTILDRHTAQLKQLTNAVSQLTTVATQQSDNIAFLLREHIVIKDDVATLKGDVATLKTDVAELKMDVAGLKTDIATLKTDVAELKQGMLDVNSKLDLILSKLN